MHQDKGRSQAKRLVWRMDALHPGGALVDPDEPVVPSHGHREPPQGSWLDSSLALLDGLQVTDLPLDSVPGDLFEGLRKHDH
jgi:hypothetical protein